MEKGVVEEGVGASVVCPGLIRYRVMSYVVTQVLGGRIGDWLWLTLQCSTGT